MKEREELELILKLIGKYNLPLSPILEYAIKEKMEEYLEEQIESITGNNEKTEDKTVICDRRTDNEKSTDSLSDELRIVDYGERTIAVVGNTKPHKDALKSLGGYFVLRTQWGPAWVFRENKRILLQAYMNGDTSVITREEEDKNEGPQKKTSSRYIIRVKYPDGRVFDSNLVWETLVDVIKYAGAERVERLNIICMGDNLVSSRLNENPIYRSAQKDIGQGKYVCTYSSTDIKYKQIVRINIDCRLGLEIEKVYIGEVKSTLTSSEDILDKKGNNSVDVRKLNKRRLVLETVKRYVYHHPQVSYETLIRVFPASLNYNKANGVIKRYDDVMKKCEEKPRTRNYFFLKDEDVIHLSNGQKVVVHSQWGDDFDQFLKVAQSLYKITISDNGYYLCESEEINKGANCGTYMFKDDVGFKEDKRIGYTVRLFPSHLKGEIIRVRTNAKGIKKLVVKTTKGDIVEVDDLPYLYQVLKTNKTAKASTRYVESLQPTRKGSFLTVGTWILWKPTNIIGKVVKFMSNGSLNKVTLRLKNGTEIEVYDNPKTYEIIK